MRRIGLLLLLMLAIGISACNPQKEPVATAFQAARPSSTPEPTSATTATFTPTVVASATSQLTQTPTPEIEPSGCQKPPDDLDLVHLNGYLINARTLAMLAHANELYAGEIDLLGSAVTQGSYTDSISASFGTHAGGGAVDISVMRLGTYTVLEDEIEPLIRALRVAGFAAWLRRPDQISPGSPIHIHAIAIGDPHLSPAAVEQVTGAQGYFRGYNGLPEGYGGPARDEHGRPVLCQWMIEMSYSDLRPISTAKPRNPQK